MTQKHKLTHPLLLTMVALLVVNDWILKATYAHPITGKLSDFAGLFVFPFFFSALWSKWRIPIHLATAAMFILWKSPLSQPAIDLLNFLKLPVARTPDYWDYTALVSIGFSLYIFNKSESGYPLAPLGIKCITIVTLLSITATTFPPHTTRRYTNINRSYHFSYSKHELVSRLNKMQIRGIKKQMNYLPVDFDSEGNIFHTRYQADTLAILIDAETVTDKDTIRYKTPMVDLLISGDDLRSSLKVVTLYRTVPMFSEKDYRKKSIKAFENRVIRSLMKK